MEHDYPKMLYKAPGPHEIHGGKFDTLIVEDEDQEEQAVADGWKPSTEEAKADLEDQLAQAKEQAKEAAAREQAAEDEARLAPQLAAIDREREELKAERERLAADAQRLAETQRAAQSQPPSQPPSDTATEATKEQLQEQARVLGIAVVPQWGIKRLQEEIAAAQAAAGKSTT